MSLMICKLYLNETIIKINVANFSYAGNDFNIIFNWPTKLSIFNATVYF